MPTFNSIEKTTRDGVITAKVLPGEYYLTKDDEVITTVLGSCIAICIRDIKTGIGGINHFMYPISTDTVLDDNALPASSFGNYAMECLFNDFIAMGGNSENLEIKMFGGGKILSSQAYIGDENIRFAKQFLLKNKYLITAEDIGGEFSRKLTYSPKSGKAMIRKLSSTHRQVIINQENNYHNQICISG